MKRFLLIVSLFSLALSLPMAYFMYRAYRGIEQQEKAELQYFATTLLDAMEEELTLLTFREEKRAVDEYSYYLSPDSVQYDAGREHSPLSESPKEPYILGYFQNNPDGSFQSPLFGSEETISENLKTTSERLQLANSALNDLSLQNISEELASQPIGKTTSQTAETSPSLFAQRYLDLPSLKEQKTRQQDTEIQKTQRITLDQFFNISRQQEWGQESQKNAIVPGRENDTQQAASPVYGHNALPVPGQTLRVEVAPLQSVLLDGQDILVFRRIVINNELYRQGFVILVQPLLTYLREAYFSKQPIAAFTTLRLDILEQQPISTPNQVENASGNAVFFIRRIFPRPFSFLQATIFGEQLPRSSERNILHIMLLLLGVILVPGLVAIYQSVRTIVDLSERRSMFVSSVTHELKTPLTNIRMYAEMLEQGIAPTREREEEYFRIVGAESQRLSRLIENVLEFSKLEKKQRHFHLHEGNFDEVTQEVRKILTPKLEQEGFTLRVEHESTSSFRYDREVMAQILLNLIENSIKFGKAEQKKEITVKIQSTGKWIKISVSDTGPGIPHADLKKVFDDFYRSEHERIRATRGTGIGLALVKKFIIALGGKVEASNNSDPGCTIAIFLPI